MDALFSYRFKPCRFCGSGAHQKLMHSVSLVREKWYVVCEACGANGPRVFEQAHAVELWNKREHKIEGRI